MIKKMINKKIIYVILTGLFLSAGFVLGVTYKDSITSKEISSFEDCISAGYPVMESYPRQCRTSDGKTFVEQTERVEKDPCGQAKYQEACEARPNCNWIGCPNNVCVPRE